MSTMYYILTIISIILPYLLIGLIILWRYRQSLYTHIAEFHNNMIKQIDYEISEIGWDYNLIETIELRKKKKNLYDARKLHQKMYFECPGQNLAWKKEKLMRTVDEFENKCAQELGETV